MDNPTLANLRITTFSLLAFVGFLRFDEAIYLRACEIKITTDMARIYLPRSKIDQLRQRNEVLIARSHVDMCPVKMLQRYMARAGITSDSEAYIFRGITRTTEGEKLRPDGALCYSTVRDLFRKKLLELGQLPIGFGLHSFRSGGASAAAQAGVPDCLFKQHGRWKSDSAKDGYIEDSKDHRLSVTRSIGI